MYRYVHTVDTYSDCKIGLWKCLFIGCTFACIVDLYIEQYTCELLCLSSQHTKGFSKLVNKPTIRESKLSFLKIKKTSVFFLMAYGTVRTYMLSKNVLKQFSIVDEACGEKYVHLESNLFLL